MYCVPRIFFLISTSSLSKAIAPYVEDIAALCFPILVVPKNSMLILFIYICVALGFNFEVEGGGEFCCST
jgi:hypothetical protein